MRSNSAAYPFPPLALLVTEPLRAALDFCSHKLAAHPAIEGDGHPVIVYPGLGAGSAATAQLRQFLQRCNFDVHDWERGINTGPEGTLQDWMEALAGQVRRLHAEHGRRVSLVGWSLGGIYARELAKFCPDDVRQVVTLATPFGAIDDGNHAGTILKLIGRNTSHLGPELRRRLRERPPVPVTSIYSRSDGVVSWRGCLEAPADDAENVQVQASHLGMPAHPDALRIVADRLAQPEGAWRPYRRRRLTRASRPSRSRR